MIVIVELFLIHTHAGAVKADKFQTTLLTLSTTTTSIPHRSKTRYCLRDYPGEATSTQPPGTFHPQPLVSHPLNITRCTSEKLLCYYYELLLSPSEQHYYINKQQTENKKEAFFKTHIFYEIKN